MCETPGGRVPRSRTSFHHGQGSRHPHQLPKEDSQGFGEAGGRHSPHSPAHSRRSPATVTALGPTPPGCSQGPPEPGELGRRTAASQRRPRRAGWARRHDARHAGGAVRRAGRGGEERGGRKEWEEEAGKAGLRVGENGSCGTGSRELRSSQNCGGGVRESSSPDPFPPLPLPQLRGTAAGLRTLLRASSGFCRRPQEMGLLSRSLAPPPL